MLRNISTTGFVWNNLKKLQENPTCYLHYLHSNCEYISENVLQICIPFMYTSSNYTTVQKNCKSHLRTLNELIQTLIHIHFLWALSLKRKLPKHFYELVFDDTELLKIEITFINCQWYLSKKACPQWRSHKIKTWIQTATF